MAGRLKERTTMSGDHITSLTWIKHELGRQDARLTHMMALYGAAGYAYYWTAVEYLAEWGGTLPRDNAEACLARVWVLYHKDKAKVPAILADLIDVGLLARTKEGDVYCPQLEEEFRQAAALRDVRSKSAKARWAK